MLPGLIEGRTNVAAAGDELAKEGVRDLAIKVVRIGDLNFMQSAWFPSPAELDLLNRGAPVILGISAPRHPVVHVIVGNPPPNDVADIPILYARAGQPGSENLRVIDCQTGKEVPDAFECDAQAGWVRVYCKDAAGDIVYRWRRQRSAMRKIRGQFRIERIA